MAKMCKKDLRENAEQITNLMSRLDGIEALRANVANGASVCGKIYSGSAQLDFDFAWGDTAKSKLCETLDALIADAESALAQRVSACERALKGGL